MEGKTVMTGNDIDAGVGLTPVAMLEVTAADAVCSANDMPLLHQLSLLAQECAAEMDHHNRPDRVRIPLQGIRQLWDAAQG